MFVSFQYSFDMFCGRLNLRVLITIFFNTSSADEDVRNSSKRLIRFADPNSLFSIETASSLLSNIRFSLVSDERTAGGHGLLAPGLGYVQSGLHAHKSNVQQQLPGCRACQRLQNARLYDSWRWRKSGHVRHQPPGPAWGTRLLRIIGQ